MALTKQERDALPDSDFAVPETRDLPMHDEKHVRMGWDMVDRTKGLSEGQRTRARHRLLERAKKLGMDTSDWSKLKASLHLNAMSLNLPPVEGHPNRMPFSGKLVPIDSPSDLPVGGAGGRRVIITREAADKGLNSLAGMAVDMTPGLDGHDAEKKIGIITAANIASDDDGEYIAIEGIIYASNFPDAAARIRATKAALGFSFEASQVVAADPGADPLVVTGCVFTGAAILRKDKAAFQTTALAAARASEGEFDVTKEELQAALDAAIKPAIEAAVKPLGDKITALEAKTEDPKKLMASNLTHMVEPHAKALEACADGMEAAGIGADETRGHATIARKMAGHLRAAAATGNIPNIYRDHDFFSAAGDKSKDIADQIKTAVEAAVKPLQDKLAEADTKLADIKAAGFTAAAAPERKTVSAEVQALLAKFDLKAGADGKLTVDGVNQVLDKANVRGPAAIATKLKLQEAGMLG